MDISSLRERRSDNTLTVSELNGYIKGVLEADRLLGAVTVKGEISNFIYHRSGHLYFTLKDDGGQIKSVMFRSSAMRLKFMPENGMKVTVHGSINMYTKDGSVQLYVNQMQPDGIGALYLAYEQLKERLFNEGLFDSEHKRRIPRIPTRIGVITSPTGAAIRDILNVLGRRFPLADIYLYPSLVQGEDAPRDLVRAVDYFDRSQLVDVIIIGRGGGSLEDLWSFNDEGLARAIFASNIPVVSAVGHEIDFTICDFVADIRAATPSHAAELVTPNCEELKIRIDNNYTSLKNSVLSTLSEYRLLIDGYMKSKALKDPMYLFDEKRMRLIDTTDKLYNAMNYKNIELRSSLSTVSASLTALNPLAVLTRGYGVVFNKDNSVVKSIENVNIGEQIKVKLWDGSLITTIEDIEREEK
jgi:exodeoxyribonuclease VII large subunit